MCVCLCLCLCKKTKKIHEGDKMSQKTWISLYLVPQCLMSVPYETQCRYSLSFVCLQVCVCILMCCARAFPSCVCTWVLVCVCPCVCVCVCVSMCPCVRSCSGFRSTCPSLDLDSCSAAIVAVSKVTSVWGWWVSHLHMIPEEVVCYRSPLALSRRHVRAPRSALIPCLLYGFHRKANMRF